MLRSSCLWCLWGAKLSGPYHPHLERGCQEHASCKNSCKNMEILSWNMFEFWNVQPSCTLHAFIQLLQRNNGEHGTLAWSTTFSPKRSRLFCKCPTYCCLFQSESFIAMHWPWPDFVPWDSNQLKTFWPKRPKTPGASCDSQKLSVSFSRNW